MLFVLNILLRIALARHQLLIFLLQLKAVFFFFILILLGGEPRSRHQNAVIFNTDALKLLVEFALESVFGLLQTII